MKSRRIIARQAFNKGDLLDQRWLTYLLAIVLILLVLVFVVLLTPEYKQYVVDTVRSIFYGGKQEAPRPKAAPVKFQVPALLDGF